MVLPRQTQLLFACCLLAVAVLIVLVADCVDHVGCVVIWDAIHILPTGILISWNSLSSEEREVQFGAHSVGQF